MPFGDTFRGKRVVVTGHTGFKGSWLCEWLLSLEAQVTGYALPPATEPDLFNQLNLEQRLKHHVGDIRDAASLAQVVADAAPDFVFHLAAQPLVRQSYAEPLETYQTNVMGTIHLLEALRSLKRPCAAVFITTDKCYENLESGRAYIENDPLGGHDPYSSSKAACEIAISSWRRSFFGADHPVRIASVRAGNVIGGGDWATDRIIPDCMRALQRGEPIRVRNPSSVRPWQHVLEPLSGYLWLASRLCLNPSDARYCSAFNLGPDEESNRTVRDVVEGLLQHWPGHWEDTSDPNALHEAGRLNLSIEKAGHVLGWRPVWDFPTTLQQTADWYRKTIREGVAVAAETRNQIEAYNSAARQRSQPWTS